ncbi:MAG: TonB-dependent receptor [Brevundimonas sp.]|nr:MAG: TonB-dependent receptor [Brevundimonas sp.]
MKINTIRARLLASTMMGGVALAAAVALPATAVLLTPAVASAQDYTTGALVGTVSDQAGNPVAGASVTVRSNEQSFTRSYTTGANGQFRANLIPQGTYEVTVNADGYDSLVNPSVAVTLNQNSGYVFTLGAVGGSTNIDDVVVVGTRAELDFSQNATGITINVDELVERVPVGRSIASVALLAPRAIEGDSAFGDQPSLGGSSVAENAFYINGLNITDFNTYVGGSTVPFDFYRTVDVQTGGYAAEFGRATGGIINAVTKSGTNEWIFELHGNWTPNELRETAPITYTRRAPGQNGITARTRPDLTETDNWSLIAEAGGPIIRDRLYAYGLYQWSENDNVTTNTAISQDTRNVNDIPFWGAKIDAYITDTQRLEFTYFNTEGSFDTVVTTRATGAVFSRAVNEVGGTNYVARYTGNWTDWLTLSAAYGVTEQQNNLIPGDPGAFQSADRRQGVNIRVPGSNVFATIGTQSTEREFYRADADITFTAMGDHHVRMGLDAEKTTLSRASVRTGGANLQYFLASDQGFGNAGSNILGAVVGVFGANGAPISGTNEAWYIQDSWDINDNLNLQIGLRHDLFSLDNLAGQQVIELKDNFGPRVGFNLDPIGDGVDKFYGSYGRYFIPIASNLSYRGADLFYTSFHQLSTAAGTTPFNADGTPIGGVGAPIVDASLDICPTAGALFGAGGSRSCFVNGDGQPEAPESKYAYGTKATNEDEFILGYERQLDDLWSVGAAVTYRKLNNVSEDIAIDYLINRYCAANGIANCEDQFTGDHQYIIANPGKDLTFLVRENLPNGTRPVLTFSAAETGITPARREYAGVEFTFDREYDGVWSLSGSYVASESIGNYEGTVLSDNGQTDAGSTILYDHRGLAEGKYGLLPNHRGHQFKLFGAYTLWDSLTVGANFRVTSPRKFGCIGQSTTDPAAAGYGSAANVCRPDVLQQLAGNRDPFYVFVPFAPGGNPIDTVAEYNAYGVTAPRGESFESDWTYNLDMSFRYTMPTFGFMPEGITLRADVFNVLNAKAVTDLDEVGGTVGANLSYGLPTGYQTPRSVRFGFDIKF